MTSDGLRVRLVEAADVVGIAEIYAPHCTDGLASLETVAPTTDEMAARVRATTATHPWLVAVGGDGRLLGYAYGSRHRERAGYRWSVDVAVYVAAAATGRGVGRALYDPLLDLLAAQGFYRAHAGIGLPNDASLALHRACGFEPVGIFREAGFKHGAWRDVQWMARPLATLRPAPDARPSSPGWSPPEPVAWPDLPPKIVASLLGLRG